MFLLKFLKNEVIVLFRNLCLFRDLFLVEYLWLYSFEFILY